MRKLSYADFDAIHDPDGDLPEDVGVADWKESVGNVLDLIDSLLEPYGLEVVQYDTRADDCAFKIEKRMSAIQQ